jgi:hypothetical protein
VRTSSEASDLETTGTLARLVVPSDGTATSGQQRAANNGATQTLRTARNNRGNGMNVERPKNGQVNQQIRRRPPQPVGAPRTTSGGFSHSHSFGLRDSQSSPKTHPKSSYRPTPNGYHDNGSASSGSDSNDSTAAKKRKGTPLRTAWELPDLVQPLHRRRTHCVKQPRLLAHYPAVVEFIYNHRYAAGFQIQRRFNDYMPSQRTSQYQLARLVDFGYLQRAPVRSTSPNFPAVFAATRRGIELVKQTYANLGIEWQATATEQLKSSGVALDSILHEVLLTEFDMAVRATIEGRGDLALLLNERRYFRQDKRLVYETNGRQHWLVPDAGFLLRFSSTSAGHPVSTPKNLQLSFVEFDNGTLSTARLAAKYKAYNEWASRAGRDYLWQLYHHYGGESGRLNFRLLIIARGKTCGSDDRRLIDLLTLAFDLPRPMRERIWLTTVSNLRLQYAPANEEPIWIRVRDARRWLPAMHQLPTPPGVGRFANRKAFVASQIKELPRRTLLPL